MGLRAGHDVGFCEATSHDLPAEVRGKDVNCDVIRRIDDCKPDAAIG